MEADVFVPFVFFTFLAVVFVGPVLVKERTKRSAHELVGQALSRGQQLDPALVSQLTQNMLDEGNRARKTLGSGVILLALAGGFVGAGYVASGFDADAMQGFMIPAVIAGSVGVAFLILAVVDYMTKRREA